MAREDLTGNKYIDDLEPLNPEAGDTRTEGDDHLRGIKNVLVKSFPNVSGAATPTHTELNYIDGTTLGTVVASKAVAVDASKDIGTFGDVTAATFIGAVTGNVTGDVTGNVTGNIDGTVGAGTPAAIVGTTIKANTTFEAASGTTINEFSTDGTFGGNSDNAVPTEKAIKTYVDASAPSAITAGTVRSSGDIGSISSITTQTHGLGAVPTFVNVYLECTTGDNGWSAGDMISFQSIHINTAGSSSGITVGVDATNIIIAIDNSTQIAIAVSEKTTAGHTDLDEDDWKVTVAPFLVT